MIKFLLIFIFLINGIYMILNLKLLLINQNVYLAIYYTILNKKSTSTFVKFLIFVHIINLMKNCSIL